MKKKKKKKNHRPAHNRSKARHGVVWDKKGKRSILGRCVRGASCDGQRRYGRESIANAVRDQLIKLNYSRALAGSISGSDLCPEKLIATTMPCNEPLYYCNSGSKAKRRKPLRYPPDAHKRYGQEQQDSLFATVIYHGTTMRFACLQAVKDDGTPQNGPF